METGLLSAVTKERAGGPWQEELTAVLREAESYRFLRLITGEGAAVWPLLQQEKKALQSAGTLTVDGIIFNLAGDGTWEADYGVANEGGFVTLNNVKMSGAGVGQVYHYSGDTTINNVTTTDSQGTQYGTAYCGVYYLGDSGTLTINGGTFDKIAVDSGNYGGIQSVAELLGEGCAYKKQESTWATDDEMAGWEISNVTVKKIPLTINPLGDTSWYYSTQQTHTPEMNAAPAESGNSVSYVWKNGETTLDCTSDACTVPAGTPVGSCTYTCEATCDGYTLSHTFTFKIEKSGTEFTGGVKTYKDGAECSDFTAGDTITVKATPTATGTAPANSAMFAASFTPPTTGQMAVFVNGTQVSEPVGAGEDGSYTMTVSASEVLFAGKCRAERQRNHPDGKSSTPIARSELEGETELTGPVTVKECQHTGVEVKNLGSGKHGLTCPYCGYHYEHTTALTATASGNNVTLNGGCGTEGCGYSKELGTVSFTFPKLTYGETGNVSVTWDAPAGYYVMLNTDKWQSGGTAIEAPIPLATLFSDAPLSAGGHKLKVSFFSDAGVYSNECELNFTIDPAPLTDSMVSLSAENVTYNGAEQKPAVTVKHGETLLTTGTDYTVAYSDNVDVGTATVTANSQTITKGDPIPSYTCTVSPTGANLGFAPALSCDYATDSGAGKYPITVTGAETSADGNYTITYVNGTLTVKEPSSSGGGSGGGGGGDTPVNVTGVSLDRNSLTLTIGESFSLTVTITPSNADNKSVTWASGNSDVASVNGGTVTATGVGTTTITITTQSGGYTASCTVTVKAKAYTITYDANGGARTMTDGIAPDQEAFVLPECGFTAPEGKEFDCWAIGSVTGPKVQPGGGYTFTANTTVYALWKDLPPVPYDITGIVWQNGKVVPGATVQLKQGADVVAAQTTGADGGFTFSGVPAGVYNLVAIKDGITVTVMQEITSGSGGNHKRLQQRPAGTQNTRDSWSGCANIAEFLSETVSLQKRGGFNPPRFSIHNYVEMRLKLRRIVKGGVPA